MVNTKSNRGSFKKGQIPWNKGKKIELDFNLILKKYYKEEMSTRDIGEYFKVNQKTIENRLKERGYKLRKRTEKTERTKQKISKTMKEREIQPKKRYSGIVWNKGLTQEDERVRKNIKNLLKNRKTQILPVKDSSIEVKIQNLLKKLGIEFFTHQYMKIEHGYQCDIMIPVQNGINQKTIIECFGNYWHNYPISREIDIKRCDELRKEGWRVLVLWENEIKLIKKEDLLQEISI